MNTVELLKIIQHALNQLPNQKINHPQVSTTYDLAELVDKHLLLIQGGTIRETEPENSIT